MKTYIGIDNGSSGWLTALKGNWFLHVPMPVKKEQSYTKKKQLITRIDVPSLVKLLSALKSPTGEFVLLERAMCNPMRFKASMAAMRSLEAVLIALELTDIPYSYCDSKHWQREFLPEGVSGKELKVAAVDIARRLFPDIKTRDADSLLIAEYSRRKGL